MSRYEVPAFSFLQDSNLQAGPILPLLYSHHIRPRHSTPFLYPSPPKQRSVPVLPGKWISKPANANGGTDIEDTAPRIKSDFKPLDDALIQGQKRKQWRRERRLKRILTVAAGWLTIALMMYLIAVTKTAAPKIWDPYSILEISRVGVTVVCWLSFTDYIQSSTEQQIKKRYRDLSRIYHPDKVVVDESKNQTAEDINDYWVEVTKAFKTLTDEEIRNNYIQYGHPDGKQSFSIGIALPKFIVTDGNGKYVLLVYGLLLGVLLPYVVGKWWYGTQKLTKEKVLLASASNLFREYKEDMKDGDVVNALSSGEEYKDVFGANKVDSGLGKIEKSIVQEDEAGPILMQKDHQKLESYDGARRKAAALIWAYLGRIHLDGATLDDGLSIAFRSTALILLTILQKNLRLPRLP